MRNNAAKDFVREESLFLEDFYFEKEFTKLSKGILVSLQY